MKGQRILLGVAVVVLAVCAVAFLIIDGPREALWPGLYAIAAGIGLYWHVKHPPAPARWDRRRILLSASVLIPITVAMVAILIWVLVTVPDWPVRILATAGLVLVPALLFWLLRTARRDDQLARNASEQG